MKSKSILFLLFALLLITAKDAFGQQVLDQFYRSDFTPEELNTPVSERIKKSHDEYLKVYQLPEKEVDGFVLQNNFYLERLNKSGEIFYGDEISAYLNALKDILLKDDYRRTFVHVYLVNYPQINAFTNDFGNIYMNVGTIAKLETEEQLMTVLAHEISHILLKHSLKTEEHLDSLQNIYSSSEFRELEEHQFSQNQELQADSMAYTILKKSNIPVVGIEAMFYQLKYNDNPVYTGDVNLSLLLKRSYALEALQQRYQESALVEGLNLTITVPAEQEKSATHPTIEKRIELLAQLNPENDSIVQPSRSQSAFLDKRKLAGLIMVNTYMTGGYYVDGLYHTLKLLESDSTDLFLQKAKMKYLILLTQEKYRGGIGKFLINDHGNECNSADYHKFRQFIVDLSPVDMNLLTNMVIEDAGYSQDTYVVHLLSVSYQFLYKNNLNLFKTSGNGNIVFVSDSLLLVHDKVVWSASKTNTGEDVDEMDKLKAQGYLFHSEQQQVPQLLKKYVSEFYASEEKLSALEEAVRAYKLKRILYERTLTADYFPRTLDPVLANKMYEDARFDSRVTFNKKTSTALVESLTYYLTSKNGDIKDLNLSKTIELEERFNKASFDNELFNYDLSGSSYGEKRSVLSNYTRFSFLTWMNESLTLEDLNFSSVDEEIWSYRKINSVEYLVFNINVVARNKGKGARYLGIYYDMYLDLNTGGISYVSVIPTRHNPTKKTIQLIQYTSNRQLQIYRK